VEGARPYFVLPLQLNSDAQIRDHSRFADMAEVLEFVLRSIALHAPAESRLVIKNHPLDMGLMNYSRIISDLSVRFGLVGRVEFLETGDLQALLSRAAGTVTVNSTVGALALGFACPTIALSDPIYNLPGLTFQAGLDDFWNNPPTPDAELYRCFRNTVIHTTQVNGGFYSREGIALAVENCQRMLNSDRSPLDALL
jgi:capsular polysaccharide export protein